MTAFFFLDQLELWEESWTTEGPSCHADSIERPSTNTVVNSSLGVYYNYS